MGIRILRKERLFIELRLLNSKVIVRVLGIYKVEIFLDGD